MTQWCATATGVLAALALVATARYRAVSVTQRRRADRLRRDLARLQEQLGAELSRRGADLAAVQQEQELTASTQRAFLSVARRILVMAHDQQALLDEMERTHDDPALLEGLLKADHAAAQQARLAQTLAVLCGARAAATGPSRSRWRTSCAAPSPASCRSSGWWSAAGSRPRWSAPPPRR